MEVLEKAAKNTEPRDVTVIRRYVEEIEVAPVGVYIVFHPGQKLLIPRATILPILEAFEELYPEHRE